MEKREGVIMGKTRAEESEAILKTIEDYFPNEQVRAFAKNAFFIAAGVDLGGYHPYDMQKIEDLNSVLGTVTNELLGGLKIRLDMDS